MKLVTARTLLHLWLAAALACCVTQARPAAAGDAGGPQPAAQQEPSASQRLKRLFAASDEAKLRRNPLLALARGDLRYADRFGDYISDEYFAAEKAAAESDLAALKAIDRAALSPDERVSHDAFRWQTELALRGYRPDILAATVVRPINQSGLHVEMPDISSGKGAAPFKTVADYENNLKRLDGFVLYLDRSIGRMREGIGAGVVQPKVVMEEVLRQLDRIIEAGVNASPYYGPVENFPEGFTDADRARLKAGYASFIRERLLPAHLRLRDFIRTEYLPRARDTAGISALRGGPELYRHLVEASTTTAGMTPGRIHRLGLREVARIRGEIERVKRRVGFRGTLAQFFEFMRSSPRSPTSSPAATRSCRPPSAS